MTKMVSIKTADELEQAIVEEPSNGQPFVEFTHVDGTLKAVRVGRATFRLEAYGTCGVFREIDHEEADKHRVLVTHPAFASLNRYFDDSREARSFAAQYDDIADANVMEGLVRVQIDGAGKIIAELAEDGIAKPLAPQDNGGDDLPF